MEVLAHELGNRLTDAMVAFTILQKGTVGIGGSTGAMLGRNLREIRDILKPALARVDLEFGPVLLHRVSVAEVVGDAEVEAAMVAEAGGFRLAVSAIAHGIYVEVDQQVLSAAISSVLQNAFKFSRRHGQVSLRATATADRVMIDIEDECGGLPPGMATDLSRSFQQQSATRSGASLGLNISRKGIEAMGGTLSVRDLPGRGCVFTIELPRLPVV
jgi:hypothetical protein